MSTLKIRLSVLRFTSGLLYEVIPLQDSQIINGISKENKDLERLYAKSRAAPLTLVSS